ncbi:MAG: hypothetical protein JXR65_05970 [Bacteroidales bacterium]|nr:hypothetical protein [Bacteroidales bacterium]
MKNRVIQTIGTIAKEETFAQVEHVDDLKHQVLESVRPFPGYHGSNLPGQKDADSYFMVTKLRYNDDKLIRAIMQTNKELPFICDAAPGTIHLQQENFNIIRIRDVKAAQLPELIDSFRKSDIDFQKKKKLPEITALLRIRKFFSMEETIEGIFRDQDRPDFSYLELPIGLLWSSFKSMTEKLKYNIEDSNFDAALGHVYCPKGLLDFVRIYDKNFKIGKLIYIKEKYLEYIAKL